MNKEDFLQKPVEDCLDKIGFIKRFKQLSEVFNITDDVFEMEIDVVLQICKDLGLLIKYSKSKGFYVNEHIFDYDFTFGFTVKFNSFDFGLSVKNKDRNIFSAAPWHFLIDLMIENNNIRRVNFRNYEDLKNILKVSFEIYDDFKKELVK